MSSVPFRKHHNFGNNFKSLMSRRTANNVGGYWRIIHQLSLVQYCNFMLVSFWKVHNWSCVPVWELRLSVDLVQQVVHLYISKKVHLCLSCILYTLSAEIKRTLERIRKISNIIYLGFSRIPKSWLYTPTPHWKQVNKRTPLYLSHLILAFYSTFHNFVNTQVVHPNHAVHMRVITIISAVLYITVAMYVPMLLLPYWIPRDFLISFLIYHGSESHHSFKSLFSSDLFTCAGYCGPLEIVLFPVNWLTLMVADECSLKIIFFPCWVFVIFLLYIDRKKSK